MVSSTRKETIKSQVAGARAPEMRQAGSIARHTKKERRTQDMDFLEAMGYSEEELQKLERRDRIKARSEANTIRETARKYNLENIKFDSCTNMTKTGTTASGKRFSWYGIYQCTTITSLYCGTLTIDGKTVFTRGTLQAALKYLAE